MNATILRNLEEARSTACRAYTSSITALAAAELEVLTDHGYRDTPEAQACLALLEDRAADHAAHLAAAIRQRYARPGELP